MCEVHELLQSLFAAVYLLWSSPDGGKPGKLDTFDNREQVVEDALPRLVPTSSFIICPLPSSRQD